MAKTTTPAQILKSIDEITQLSVDPRLQEALRSIADDTKLFAKAKAKPEALLAKHGMKLPSRIETILKLSKLTRAGRRITLCFHYRYEREGGVVYDENGNAHKLIIVIEGQKCTSVLIPF
jgi:hypothetical protein